MTEVAPDQSSHRPYQGGLEPAVAARGDEDARCALCEGTVRPWLFVPADFARPLERRSFSLYWCDPCGYGLVWPRPDSSEVARFYELDEYFTHTAEGGPVAAAARLRLLDRARQHLAWRFDRGLPLKDSVIGALARPRLSICDVGCGNGWLLLDLRNSGHEVMGIEMDPTARQVAASRGLQVLDGSAERMPTLPPASFDIVVMAHVLEHTLDPVAAIGNATRLVKPTGRLIIEVPNNACASLASRGVAWPWLDVPRHLNFFTPRSLRAISRIAALEVVKLEWTGYFRMFSESWIDEERARWDRFAGAGHPEMPPRASKVRSWALLLQTALAPSDRKYDSVRIVARPGGAGEIPEA